MSFVAVRLFVIASLLPAGSGCFGSSSTSSTFSDAEVPDASFEPDGERIYDPPPLWSGGAQVLVETGEQALSLALDSSDVYWQNPGGSVFACPLDGCSNGKPTLLSSLVGPKSGALQTLAAADGVAVFLTDEGDQISSFAGADPSHAPVTYRTTAGSGFVTLTTDATHAYFVDTVVTSDGGYSATSTLYACALGASCTSPKRLHVGGNEASLSLLSVAGGEVYFMESLTKDTIRAVPTSGGTVRTVCTSDLLRQAQALVVAGGYVYFTTSADATSVYDCPAPGAGVASVYIRDLQPYALASDGANLYWTNYVYGPGSVVTCALGATCDSPFTVAPSQDNVFAVAANAKSVYWATASKIYRADR
jgi:hypothetical protein